MDAYYATRPHDRQDPTSWTRVIVAVTRTRRAGDTPTRRPGDPYHRDGLIVTSRDTGDILFAGVIEAEWRLFVLTGQQQPESSTTIQVVSYNESLREQQPDDPYDYQCFEFSSHSRMRRLQVCLEYGIRRAMDYRRAVEDTVITDAVVQGIHVREPY